MPGALENRPNNADALLQQHLRDQFHFRNLRRRNPGRADEGDILLHVAPATVMKTFRRTRLGNIAGAVHAPVKVGASIAFNAIEQRHFDKQLLQLFGLSRENFFREVVEDIAFRLPQ